MLVVLSDLHFSETESSQIGDLEFNKNLPAETYAAYFSELNRIALANQIEKVEIVLAGDIFEITRSAFWLETNLRPYQDNQLITPGSDSERLILKIINEIAETERVDQTLELFRTIGTYFDMPVALHFIPGNHDRLVNTTLLVRSRVRNLLGLPDRDGSFEHHFLFKRLDGSTFCLVRHGHEYDPMNFFLDTHLTDLIPTEIPEPLYDAAPLGDIITIEFGAGLPFYFVEIYKEETILENPILTALYERLMGFDDVRPSTALLSYLFSTPGVSRKQTWAYMEPCFRRVLDNLSDNPQFVEAIKSMTTLGKAQRLLLTGLMNANIFERKIPYWLIKQVMKRVSKTIKLPSQAKWAKKEALIQSEEEDCRVVISGHTHFPEVTLISGKQGIERYYINTGTWRTMIPATKNFKEFGQTRGMTEVIVFKPHEKPAPGEKQNWSFIFFTGVSYGNHHHMRITE